MVTFLRHLSSEMAIISAQFWQARGEREVRDTRDERGASRSPRACPRSPEKRKKITPVLQARVGAILFSQ